MVRHMKRKHGNIQLHRETNSLSGTQVTASASCSGTNADSHNNSSPTGSSRHVLPPLIATYQTRKCSQITDYTTSTRPLPIHRSKQIDSQLTMIVKEYHPFKIVEDPEFQNLIHLLCPTYHIPTRKTISCSLLPTVYNELKQQMQATFKNRPDTPVCLTADGWTSQNNEYHFYAITAHFIDEYRFAKYSSRMYPL